jgi:hypothetical protein
MATFYAKPPSRYGMQGGRRGFDYISLIQLQDHATSASAKDTCGMDFPWGMHFDLELKELLGMVFAHVHL